MRVPLRSAVAWLAMSCAAVCAAADAAGVGDGGERSTFSLVSVEEVQSCPFPSKCGHWPAAGDGTVRLYTSDESFGSSSTYRRFFYTFVPASVSEPAPLVVYLHGGYMSGLMSLKTKPFHGWAAGHQRTWKRNTPSCKMTWNHSDPLAKRFETAAGEDCDPDDVTTEAPTGYVVVYPSGLQDRRVCSTNPPRRPVRQTVIVWG